MSESTASRRTRPIGILVVAALMIVFGIAEVITGFTHDFFGVSTTRNVAATFVGAAIGALYIVAGALVLSLKRRAAAIAIILLAADVVGRVVMVAAGLYPADSPKQVFSIIAGTAIAAVFAIYLGLRWKSFTE